MNTRRIPRMPTAVLVLATLVVACSWLIAGPTRLLVSVRYRR
jgi:hypothetical protein